MLQLTARRVAREGYSKSIIIGSIDHRDEIMAQLEPIEIDPGKLIFEPVGRNTAPAIALAALSLKDDATLLIMPSDHVISDEQAFHQAVDCALPLAHDGWIVALGVAPTRVETGYGYIEAGDALGPGILRAKRFVEKPSATIAGGFINSGKCYWNAGIFVVRASRYLSALGEYAPDVLEAAARGMDGAAHIGRQIIPGEEFARSPSISIDKAILERDPQIAVAPASMGWSDVGSWDSLYDIGDKDKLGNVMHGSVRAFETTGCLARTDGPRINLLGVADLIVVVAEDEVLILRRGDSQSVQKLGQEINGNPSNDARK